MGNQLLKANEVEINAAGYLVSTKDQAPVNHPAFVAQQRAAEYTVKLAAAIKDANFKGGKVDSFAAIKAAVYAAINEAQEVVYVAAPKEPKSKLVDELAKYAEDFANHLDAKSNVAEINGLMNQFNSIKAIEEVGDYFSEGLVRLTKIYTTTEILEAVTLTVEKFA
jgi:hypothetical protein